MKAETYIKKGCGFFCAITHESVFCPTGSKTGGQDKSAHGIYREKQYRH
jgi:hypothetical protein